MNCSEDPRVSEVHMVHQCIKTLNWISGKVLKSRNKQSKHKQKINKSVIMSNLQFRVFYSSKLVSVVWKWSLKTVCQLIIVKEMSIKY